MGVDCALPGCGEATVIAPSHCLLADVSVHGDRMFVASSVRLRRRRIGTFVASRNLGMGRIELANTIAASAREAQQRGAHKEAAELFARALRVLAEQAPGEQGSDLWEQIRTHPPAKTGERRGPA